MSHFYLVKYIYLWWGSKVDDALQLQPVSKLFHQEGMPVLVDGPLCRADTSELKHVQGKDVSDRTQSILSKKNKQTTFTCTCLVQVTSGHHSTYLSRGHWPVAVDRALIDLDRSSLRGEQASRRRLQLRPYSAHTGIRLKSVRPALRVLVHHLQQVTNCGLRGSLPSQKQRRRSG